MQNVNIVLYRNPYEQLFWESSGPLVVLSFIAVYLLVFCCIATLFNFLNKKKVTDSRLGGQTRVVWRLSQYGNSYKYCMIAIAGVSFLPAIYVASRFL